MKIILRIIINAIALWVTAYFMPSIVLTGDIVGLLIVAVVFGVVNALIRPIVGLLSLPITCLTLGLFTLVINAAMLLLTSWLAGSLLDFTGTTSQQFITAIIAGLIISIVSGILSMFLSDKNE